LCVPEGTQCAFQREPGVAPWFPLRFQPASQPAAYFVRSRVCALRTPAAATSGGHALPPPGPETVQENGPKPYKKSAKVPKTKTFFFSLNAKSALSDGGVALNLLGLFLTNFVRNLAKKKVPKTTQKTPRKNDRKASKKRQKKPAKNDKKSQQKTTKKASKNARKSQQPAQKNKAHPQQAV